MAFLSRIVLSQPTSKMSVVGGSDAWKLFELPVSRRRIFDSPMAAANDSDTNSFNKESKTLSRLRTPTVAETKLSLLP
jgi:hypothetical protein